jgi:hypothetical protein
VTWNRQPLLGAVGRSAIVGAVAAGINGLLATASTFDDATSSVTTDIWYSSDGVSWVHRDFPLASGPAFSGLSVNSVVAFNGQFVVVGSDNEHSMSWITHDGSSWTAAALPDGIGDNSQVSLARSVAASNGRLAVLGSIQSTEQVGFGYNGAGVALATTGHSEVAVWSSDDGLTWTRATVTNPSDAQLKLSGSLTGGSQGFVGAVRLLRPDHFVEATITSDDGREWTLTPSALAGPRSDLAATPSGWIAVGSDIDYSLPAPGNAGPHQTPQSASVWIAADA